MNEDRTQPNPNWEPVKDNEICGKGFDLDRQVTWIDVWDEQNHSIHRKFSDGTEEILIIAPLPRPVSEYIVPIIHKRKLTN